MELLTVTLRIIFNEHTSECEQKEGRRKRKNEGIYELREIFMWEDKRKEEEESNRMQGVREESRSRCTRV